MGKQNRKTALITDSTDGVGRVVAQPLGEDGLRVLVRGRDWERGERVVAEIIDHSGTAKFLAADLAALAEARRPAGARTDRLDILINNAGIGTASGERWLPLPKRNAQARIGRNRSMAWPSRRDMIWQSWR